VFSCCVSYAALLSNEMGRTQKAAAMSYCRIVDEIEKTIKNTSG